MRTQGRKGDDGSHTASPPPPLAEGQVPRLVPAPCLRRAYARGRTARTPPPPPHPLLPHPPRKRARTARRRRGDMGGGGGRGQTDAPGVETAGGRWRCKKKNKKQSKPTRRGKKARRQGPIPRRTGGGRGDMGPQETLVRYPTSGVWRPQRRNPPPPHCSQVPHPVLASCLRHACYKGKTTRAPPPPPSHTPPPPRGWGMPVAERGPPPPRGQSGRVGRQRREGAGRSTRPCPKGARTVPAPTGGPPGVRPQGRKGDDGSHTASPLPTCRGTSAAPRACTVLATCLRQRTGSEDAPPPHPLLLHPPKKGARTARGQLGDMGGGGQRTDRNAGGRDEWRAA